jgi:hypothetical protein
LKAIWTREPPDKFYLCSNRKLKDGIKRTTGRYAADEAIHGG